MDINEEIKAGIMQHIANTQVDLEIDELAKNMYKHYQSFLNAGFSRKESFEIMLEFLRR